MRRTTRASDAATALVRPSPCRSTSWSQKPKPGSCGTSSRKKSKRGAWPRGCSTRGAAWTLHYGDSVAVLPTVPEASVDFSVYSPPFIALYTYTNSERDIGNCATREEFLAHYAYVVREVLRVTKPGRLSAVHIAQTTTTKATHGIIGLTDLRGAVIALHVREGWIYHGEVCIDKDPQAQAIRKKSKALL